MENRTGKKNLQWMYSVLFITGLLLMVLVLLLRNPRMKLEMGFIVITRQEMLTMISVMGILIAIMGGLAFPKADTNGKRRAAIGIVIIGSAIVITALLLKL